IQFWNRRNPPYNEFSADGEHWLNWLPQLWGPSQWRASHRAVTQVNPYGLESTAPRRPSPHFSGEGSMDCRKGLMRRNTSAGLVGTARWQGHAEQLEKPSSPRREIGGAGKPYNRQHREVGGRREGFGWVCSSEEAE